VIFVFKSHLSLFVSGEVFDSLVGFEVIFNKMDFSGSVNPFKSVGRISIHVSVTVWSSSIREKNGDLMKSFWGVLPEIEDHIWVSQVCGWVSLLGVEEIWELDWVVDEENRGVVSNHIVVTLLSVMLDGKTTWVTITIISTTLTCDSGEAKEDWSLFTNGVQEFGLA
jgi:hypothetical protein